MCRYRYKIVSDSSYRASCVGLCFWAIGNCRCNRNGAMHDFHIPNTSVETLQFLDRYRTIHT